MPGTVDPAAQSRGARRFEMARSLLLVFDECASVSRRLRLRDWSETRRGGCRRDRRLGAHRPKEVIER